MQIVSKGDNLHEISNSILWENEKKNISVSSAGMFLSILSITATDF